MAGGSSSQRSTPVDMTPEVFKNLQGPLSSVVASLLGYGGPQGGPYDPTYGGAPNQPSSGTALGSGTVATPGGGTGTAPAGTGGFAQQPGNLGNRLPQGAFQYNPYTRMQAPPGNAWFATGGESEHGTMQNVQYQLGAFNPQGTGTGGTGGSPQFSPTGDPNDVLRGIPGYQGPLTANITGREQSLLDQLMAGGGQMPQQVKDYLSGTIGGQFMPGGAQPNPLQLDPNSPNFGQVPQLSKIDFNALPGVNPGMVGSSSFGQAPQIAGANPLTGTLPGVDPGTMGGNFGGTDNPFLQAAIEAAQRPTLQGLEETLSRTLPGRFTQGGQFVQPKGSSAFDRAAAIATRGAADAMGDIATKISYQTFADERNRQLSSETTQYQGRLSALQSELQAALAAGQTDVAAQLQSQIANQQAQLTAQSAEFEAQHQARMQEHQARLQAGMAELDAALQKGETEYAGQLQQQLAQMQAQMQKEQSEFDAQRAASEQIRGYQAQEQLQGREQAFQGQQAERDRQQQAAGLQAQVTQQEFDNMVSNLQAQALPRLIEEMGVERGIQEFQNRMNTLMVLLQTAGGVSSPVIAQQSSGKSSQFNLKSDARIKDNIKRIGTTILGLPLYAYTKMGQWEIGVMAQDVMRVIPEAVTMHGLTGVLMVDYKKLIVEGLRRG